jgi:diguanylate cyclase (GGDEF)-like protein
MKSLGVIDDAGAMLPAPTSSDTDYVEHPELRSHVARALERRATSIVNEAVAVFPYAGLEAVAADSYAHLAGLFLDLLAATARDGALDTRDDLLDEFRQAAEHARAGLAHLFRAAYLVERAALDALASDDSFGATSEPWPALAQIVRRSSFEVLASYADRLGAALRDTVLTDPLTTVHPRPVLIAALEKEIHRAERSGTPFALMLVDVDRLSEINEKHGYGSGDRVLERLGILMRNYFRGQDWVGRTDGNAFGILLPDTHAPDADLLAERLRATVEDRIALHDYRSEEQLAVTVSVGIVTVTSVDGSIRADDVCNAAGDAIRRAKAAGRNRIEKATMAARRPDAPLRHNPLEGI